MRPFRMIDAVPAAACLLALLGCSGCTERSGEEAQGKTAAAAPAAQPASPDPGEDDETLFERDIAVYYLPPEWVVDTGETDGQNRYMSAVEVRPRGVESGAYFCTGVLVSPRLVLTSASCVCSGRPAAQSDGSEQRVNGKACATEARVTSAIYDPPTDGEPSSERGRAWDGVVRVHPAFKEVVDEAGNLVSSDADLAVIVLGEAADVPPVELAESAVKGDESLVVVGYGDCDGGNHRRFSEHRVTMLRNSGGRIAFAQPPYDSYKGARGGPCLRQTGHGMRLAGILSTSVGQEALFTSVYPHREWVRAEIRSAADAVVPARPASP